MRKTFYIFSLLLAGIFIGETAKAQCPGSPPIGTIYLCHFVNGQKVIDFLNGLSFTNISSGRAQFQVAGYSTTPCTVFFEVVSFYSDGIGEIGTISTRLIPATRLTLLTGTAESLFPATLDLYMGLSANGSALGPYTYNSNGDLHLQASGVMTLPFQGLEVMQTNGLVFTREDGLRPFMLENTTVWLNP